MIALPGLCLATGRYDDAKKIIAAFAASVSEGMLPNRFTDNGAPPEYNNVDGTLWYFIAVYKYLQATNDTGFVLKEILPVLKNIIDHHYHGTRYHIHVDTDELLYSGEAGVQLTWMDARIGDWVVTPRTGKAVEINALWYNALKIFTELLYMNKEDGLADKFKYKSRLVKEKFNDVFWNHETSSLFDVVNGEESDASIRPNQLFAISLPFELVDDEKARQILEIVEEKLYTPVGLRSLPADHPDYKGTYAGDPWHRDSAYHQGTVWSWLLGPYIDALMKTGIGKPKVNKVIEDFRYHLSEAGIGTISEIFDGDAPHSPQGCIAQAWSVGEILRVMKEYKLSGETGKSKKKSTQQAAV
jgi:predicted glycogen debranching enzyme